ncbi:MAG: DinB family protein [Propionicimonas sp.]|uniref:DinB family protein n=1 Tax=Propionicimonas sp. TaxID=1955623 RepID=UPI003D0B6465
MSELDTERADLLAALDRHRGFLLFTALRLTDDQARLTSTVSELHIGGIIKHVAATERGWIAFMTGGDMAEAAGDWWQGHHMGPDETLEAIIDDYQQCAAETEAAVRALPDLNEARPLPDEPWFEPGTTWTARRVLLHILAETAQHAGHADIIREAIDGQKTMG